jgi:hypothetical protein
MSDQRSAVIAPAMPVYQGPVLGPWCLEDPWCDDACRLRAFLWRMRRMDAGS